MKAIHVNSGKVYSVESIMSGQVKLRSAKTGATRTISYESFEQLYVLRDNDEVEIGVLTQKKESVEARKLASEVLSEVPDENPQPRTRKPRTKKPQDPQPQEKEVGQSGTITLKQLCDQHNINPSKARRILRKHHIAKPYEWDDPKDILKLLK